MPTSCALTQDYLFGCDVGSGGIQQLWLIEFNNVASMVESSGVITTITKVAGKVFRKYQLVVQTANANQKIGGNVQNGTVFANQGVTVIINKQQVAMRNEINLLARNTLIMVVQDNNGTFQLFGRNNGMRLADGSADTGTNFEDRNGYTLNFTGLENELAPFVDSAVIATLQTPG